MSKSVDWGQTMEVNTSKTTEKEERLIGDREHHETNNENCIAERMGLWVENK